MADDRSLSLDDAATPLTERGSHLFNTESLNDVGELGEGSPSLDAPSSPRHILTEDELFQLMGVERPLPKVLYRGSKYEPIDIKSAGVRRLSWPVYPEKKDTAYRPSKRPQSENLHQRSKAWEVYRTRRRSDLWHIDELLLACKDAREYAQFGTCNIAPTPGPVPLPGSSGVLTNAAKGIHATDDCIPARHWHVHDEIAVRQYLDAASYIVSLGGPPTPDMRYGIVIIPQGEERLFFSNTDYGLPPELTSVIYEKSKKFRIEEDAQADRLLLDDSVTSVDSTAFEFYDRRKLLREREERQQPDKTFRRDGNQALYDGFENLWYGPQWEVPVEPPNPSRSHLEHESFCNDSLDLAMTHYELPEQGDAPRSAVELSNGQLLQPGQNDVSVDKVVQTGQNDMAADQGSICASGHASGQSSVRMQSLSLEGRRGVEQMLHATVEPDVTQKPPKKHFLRNLL